MYCVGRRLYGAQETDDAGVGGLEGRTLFKLYLCDTGLLTAAVGNGAAFALLQGETEINWGSILENAAAQILVANGFDLRYFDKAKYGEVDFLVQMGDRVLPLEMKSGADYAKHRALDNIMEVAAWGIDEALVFCRDNIRVEKAVDETTGRERTVSYLPWYCLEFLEPLGKGVSLPVDF